MEAVEFLECGEGDDLALADQKQGHPDLTCKGGTGQGIRETEA